MIAQLAAVAIAVAIDEPVKDRKEPNTATALSTKTVLAAAVLKKVVLAAAVLRKVVLKTAVLRKVVLKTEEL